MSTSKLDTSGVFQPISLQVHEQELLLSTDDVVIRKNGIEFLSHHPLPLWTEVTVDLRSPGGAGRVRGAGVVVDCTGNRHAGYVVSLILTNLTRQAQERLSTLAQTRPA